MLAAMITRRRLLGQAARLAAAAAGSGFLPAPAGTLKAAAARHGRLYGSAVDLGLLQRDPVYRRLLIEQCSIVVPENAMKWAAVHPARDRYTFDQADAVVRFAEQHGLAVRGHNLVWHEALPDWFASTVTAQNAARILIDHIHTVAGRYQGRLRAWDVVNEAVLPKDGREDGLRNSPWLRLLGPGYLDLAFRTARAADPHALLTYNEFGIEYDHAENAQKRAALLRLLRTLRAAGTPIDAVGIQSHLSAASTNALGPGILQFVTEAHTLGLKVFITELDVNDDNVPADDPATRDAAVADTYGRYVTAMLTNPAVTDILTWGVSDNHSWLNTGKTHQALHPGRQERALPFDAAYHPKPAFFALRDALGQS